MSARRYAKTIHDIIIRNFFCRFLIWSSYFASYYISLFFFFFIFIDFIFLILYKKHSEKKMDYEI